MPKGNPTPPSLAADESPENPGEASDSDETEGEDSEDDNEEVDPSWPSDEKILADALERYKLCEQADSSQRTREIDDMNFLAGDQWPIDVKAQRDSDSRPCLTINRLGQFVQQITNEQRQNRPAIKISPVNDGADEDTAKIRQGMIRHIEYSSNADMAYDTAFFSTVAKGRGFFRIYTDYCDAKSFDIDIKFGRIPNSHSVLLDPTSKEPDGNDSTFGFITEDMLPEQFKLAYPKAKLSAMEDWAALGNSRAGWISGKGCRVAEYIFIDYKSVTLVLTKSGLVIVEEEHSDEDLEKLKTDKMIVNRRKTQIPVVRHCIINGYEVLEKTNLPGRNIPIFPCYGTELYIDGERHFEGIIRHAKDPQRMYNYWASSETETIALAPKAPWIVAHGQLEGFEGQWQSSNRKNHAYLEYKSISSSGEQVPPPQRQVYEPAVQAITQARGAAADDLKATTGMYDASFGNRSNEQSGVAVQRRVQQAQTTNFHFVDNLTRTIRHAGRVINDWIPEVYDTARAVRILHPDGREEVVKINEQFDHNGKTKTYKMDVGKYDVIVDTGPSYASRREEAVQSLLDLFKSYPQAATVAGDLLVKNMDWPGKDEIAARLKKLLPPGVDDAGKKQNVPPEVQHQLQQLTQQNQQLIQELNQASETLRTEKLQLDSKERIAAIQAETTLRIAALKLDSAEAIEGFRHEMETLHREVDRILTPQPDQGIQPTPGGQAVAAPETEQPSTGGDQAPGQSMGG